MLSKGAGLGLILASENVSPLGCFVGDGVLADFCVIQKWSRVEILQVLLGLDNVAPRTCPGIRIFPQVLRLVSRSKVAPCAKIEILEMSVTKKNWKVPFYQIL